MANNRNINLGTFNFKTDDLDSKLVELRRQMTILKNDISTMRKEAANSEKEFTKISAALLAMEAAGEETSEEYQELSKLAEELNESLNAQVGLLEVTESQLRITQQEYREVSNIVNALTDSQNELNSIQDRANQLLEAENTSIAAARQSNKDILALRNQLNPAIKEEADLIELLNNRLDENNEFIKNNASAYERQKINIGNYSESIKEALTDLDIFNRQGLMTFIAKSQEAGGVGNVLVSTFKQITTGIAGITRASLAFIATPIGAVISAIGLVLGGLIKYLSSTQEGIDKITAVTRPLMAVFDSLIGLVQEVGKYLFDAFSNPKKTLEDVYNFVKDQIITVFTAYGKVLEGIFTLDWSRMKEGLQEIGDLAVENFNRLTNVATEIGNRFDEAYQKGVEIDNLQKQIERNEIEIIGLRAKTESQLKAQALIARDTSKSSEERKKAVEEMNRLTAELVNKENAILDAKIKQLEIQQSLNDTSREDEKELEMLRAERLKNEDKLVDVQRENIRIINSIRSDAANQEKKRIDDAEKRREQNFQNEIRRMRERIDLFRSEQGFRKKDLEEQLEIERRIAQDSIAILNKELANKKISREKYQAEVNKINMELAQMEAELVIQNAADELEEWKRLNQAKLENGKIWNEEMVASELERLNEQQRLQMEYELERFNRGLQTEREYQQQILNITTETETKKKEIEDAFDAQKKAERMALRASEFEAELLRMQEEGATRWEIEQAQRDEQYQLEIEKLNEQREQNLISEELYQAQLSNIEKKWNQENAQAKLQIEEQTQSAKMQLASQAFNMLADAAGKETELGKAAAATQATINTYQAATAAYSAMAGIPVVGPALGAAAAALAVATGLMNVKKIVSTKTPKTPTIQGFATGGIVTDGVPIQRSNGDDVLITAKRGEVILNQRQQSIIGTQMLRMAGVPGFATGGVVGSSTALIQNDITQRSQQIDLSETISEAVRQGAMEGSRQGSAEGSQTGLADLSTNMDISRKAIF